MLPSMLWSVLWNMLCNNIYFLLYRNLAVVKVFLAFYLTYKTFSKSVMWLAIYTAVAAIFARAVIINTLNALS